MISPPMTSNVDMSAENVIKTVIAAYDQTPNDRLKFLIQRIIVHLHEFAKETRLSSAEWEEGIKYLTAVGKTCSDVRQEFILLSDVLGLSTLVDCIDHPKQVNATEGTVLGPFHTHDAHDLEHGGEISSDVNGEQVLVICTVKDIEGKPIDNVSIDIWETDSSGKYDVQYSGYAAPDGRGILRSDISGNFWFKAILPVSYPIPHDGPVGQLLQRVNRHPYRPGHMHFMFLKPGFDPLITSLYIQEDDYINSDVVFGVKSSLIVSPKPLDIETAEKYGIEDKNCKLLTYNFVLMKEEESRSMKENLHLESAKTRGWQVRLLDGLPVPDVD